MEREFPPFEKDFSGVRSIGLINTPPSFVLFYQDLRDVIPDKFPSNESLSRVWKRSIRSTKSHEMTHENKLRKIRRSNDEIQYFLGDVGRKQVIKED